MIVKDAWAIFREAISEQREIERKRKAFEKFTRKSLNYPLIEQMVEAAAKQAPGFYSTLKFPDGTIWEFGIKEKFKRADGEAF